MNYSNRRRRSWTKMRGGYQPTSSNSSSNTKPSFDGSYRMAFITPLLRIVKQYGLPAMKAMFPKKYAALMSSPYGRLAASLISESAGAQPGVGVLVPTMFKPRMKRVINKGTGITKSTHMVGRYYIPKVVTSDGQKLTYVRSNAGDNSTISNATAITNGVLEFPTSRAGVLQTLISTSGAYTTGSTGRFFLGKVHTKLSFTSATNLNCRIRIYECVAKHDCSNVEYISPIAAWSNGLDDSLGTLTATDYTSIGIYPGHSIYFRENFHVESITDIELAAGGSHIHESVYNYSKIMNNCRVLTYATSHCISGVTRFKLIVLSSTPIHDATNEDNVALGLVTVDINNQETYEFYGLASSESQVVLDLAADAITTQEFVTDSNINEASVIN